MGVYSGNRTLLGEFSGGVEGSPHIMEMVLECQRNDMNMFNAVINCDFIEAYTEAGLSLLTEAEVDDSKKEAKKSIGKKIKELFKKAIEFVRRSISTFIAKIKNLFSNDAKLYKQYSKNFKENGEGYELTSWTPLKYISINKDHFKFIISLKNSAIDIINNADNIDTINNGLEDYKKSIKEIDINEIVNEIWFDSSNNTKDDEKYALTSNDITGIDNVMRGSNKAISEINNIGKNLENELKNTMKDLKFEKDSEDNDDLSLAKINAKYKMSNMTVSLISKTTNAMCNTYARYLAKARRAFILAGKNATEEKATNESVYDFILGEASDSYVESVLLDI